MILPSPRIKRLLFLVFFSFLIGNALLYLVLPYDNPLVLAFRFNFSGLQLWLRGSGVEKDAWLYEPARFPIEYRNDVGLLIKTGYGTRHRLAAQLEALDLTPDDADDAFVVVGDWTPREGGKLAGVTVHDAIGGVMAMPEMRSHHDAPKFKEYLSLKDAVQAGDDAKATEIGKSFGWDLDALKFIWGLEYVYDNLPPKKWYVILDDDTYLVKSSLRLLLTHWDPDVPRYVGNAVGDFKGRFAHGGSAVVISHEAARQLLARRDVVAAAQEHSLDETWGDRLVASAFQKIGVYLDERYSHFFNGERPAISKMMADRFCSPLVSFHGVADPDEMRRIGAAFRDERSPVFWGQLWDIYGAPSVDEFKRLPIRAARDYVGRTDERARVLPGTETAEACLAACESAAGKCLAWTWVEHSAECRMSPWMILGERVKGHYSGVNVGEVERLRQSC
ncbi:Glycosyltransferase family 31 [Colletotrichum higginsianum IMI 349063]|uniref:N-acetylgalactosaminide beta-1,3-galactosyltransferase n=1 Tax=Colletotrichum higginsianum (strain IMI 349063) TaxID=759273 RepID=A0A1B7XYH0_COLHI|nr:Glycosyltransferase family 31 [Colletotrichum higginsianum IMI 349063]OBR04823.1 Glycosyltransferase family 31 [Colletotrichum higginsianum IMI 349063]